MKVFAFLADGFEEIEAIATVDILRRAEIEVTTVSISNKKEVTGAHGIPVIADKLFSETNFSSGDLLFLPGGMPGTKHLDKHEGLRELLLKYNSEGKKIAAICAAPIVLAHNGLLDGKDAICYPGFEEDLSKAKISDKTVVKSGTIITGKGPGVSMKFALTLIEELKGKALANAVSKGLCFEG
mgnify:CR=1 FL=1